MREKKITLDSFESQSPSIDLTTISRTAPLVGLKLESLPSPFIPAIARVAMAFHTTTLLSIDFPPVSLKALRSNMLPFPPRGLTLLLALLSLLLAGMWHSSLDSIRFLMNIG
jgi:hypothetical protein